MEDHLQTILIFIISAVILFIFPVYIAYEKKDDISYALVLKYTQEFVEDISEKGYITKDDYETYRGMLGATGNMYDIELQHKYVTVSPVVKYYNKITGAFYRTKSLPQYETECVDAMTGELKNPCTIAGTLYNIDIVQNTQTENYDTKTITNSLNTVGKYYMNKDDTISIVVKNTNTTLATLMYNIVSLNDNKTRIYVNCSKKVLDTKWYSKDITYNVSEIGIAQNLAHLRTEALLFSSATTKVTADTTIGVPGSMKFSYNIECKLYPLDVIDIKELYSTQNPSFGSPFIVTNPTGGTPRSRLMVYVGINGIMVSVIYPDGNRICILSYQGNITSQNLIEIVVNSGAFGLFIDGIRVSSSLIEEITPSLLPVYLFTATKISKDYVGVDVSGTTYLKVYNAYMQYIT